MMIKRNNNTLWTLFIKTRSPEQDEDFDTTNEVLDVDEYKNCIVVFDAMLDSNQKTIDPFLQKEDIKF